MSGNKRSLALICAGLALAGSASAEFSIDEQFLTRGGPEFFSVESESLEGDAVEADGDESLAKDSQVDSTLEIGSTESLAIVAEGSDALTLEISEASTPEEEVGSSGELVGEELAPYVPQGHYVIRGDTLRDVLPELAKQMGYTRVLVDFPAETAVLGEAQSKGGRVSVEGLSAAQQDLYEVFDGIGSVQLYAALDGEFGAALVASTRAYANPNRLRIFEVESGSLRDNAVRLANEFGWRVPETNGWQNTHDFNVAVGYPVIVSGIAEGFHRLFGRYPVQAQLIDGHQTAVFVSRTLPVRGEQ